MSLRAFSDEILEEYRDVSRRPKFGFDRNEVQYLERLLPEHGELTLSTAIESISPDPGDDTFIACALAAKAEFLVTGNKRHYRESWLWKREWLTPES